MHRYQNPACFYSALVALRLVFRNTETDKTAGNSANDTPGPDTGADRKEFFLQTRVKSPHSRMRRKSEEGLAGREQCLRFLLQVSVSALFYGTNG